jgi:hypothetical protein
LTFTVVLVSYRIVLCYTHVKPMLVCVVVLLTTGSATIKSKRHSTRCVLYANSCWQCGTSCYRCSSSTLPPASESVVCLLSLLLFRLSLQANYARVAPVMLSAPLNYHVVGTAEQAIAYYYTFHDTTSNAAITM